MTQEKLEELFKILKTQDARIDYNFNTLIQTTIIVEFLFQKLQELNPDLNIEEEFLPFQKKRLEELEEIVNEAKQSLEEDDETLESALDMVKL